MGTVSQPSSIKEHVMAEVSSQKQESHRYASASDSTHLVSCRCPAEGFAVVEIGEIAGLHPIAIEELNKLPPLPHLAVNLVPAKLLARALSIRRFEVVPNRNGAGLLIITHLRFFLRLQEGGAGKTRVQIEIVHGLTADAIRQRVRADIYDAALADGVPVPALPSIAQELESEFPKCPNRRTISGKEMVARCFGVDVRRFAKSGNPLDGKDGIS